MTGRPDKRAAHFTPNTGHTTTGFTIWHANGTQTDYQPNSTFRAPIRLRSGDVIDGRRRPS
jgi:hypothetical protein